MKIRLRRSLLSLAAVLTVVFVVTGCANEVPEVTVFAAASLADVLQPLGERFEAQQGIDVKFSFGGSWALAQQVVRGAPADAFLAAGPGPMDALDNDGLLAPGSRSDLLSNSLVLVVTDASGVAINTPSDLLGEGVSRVALGDPALSPAGSYAREALRSMGLWEELRGKLVYGLNVRTALQYVRSGNADIAIVYATDTASAEGLRVLWVFPPDAHSPIRYPAAAMKAADNPEGAAAFLAFLHSEEASAVFREHGFKPVGN